MRYWPDCFTGNLALLPGNPERQTPFIGCGDEANVLITEHPPEYMEIVAVADPRPANIERTFKGSHPEARIGLNKKLGQAKASEIKVYKDHLELLEARTKGEVEFEMVVIAVPLSQHAPIAIACLDAGLHVLTEKLMAHNITQCKQMIRKAEEKGLCWPSVISVITACCMTTPMISSRRACSATSSSSALNGIATTASRAVTAGENGTVTPTQRRTKKSCWRWKNPVV
jgi:hypothetical protein